MKKICLILVICLVVVCGCGKKAYNEEKWSEETFFSSVYVPKGEVTKLQQDYSEEGRENYSVIVNDFSYDKFYDYIMALEEDGFHYEFVGEAVPDDQGKLDDPTETSWAAHKDNIYIIANWRSNGNVYYNGYNLQLLFYNYNYAE